MIIPMDLFRGYVPLGKGKKPAMKYKNEKLKTFDDVKDGNFAGVMNKGYIMVDVDDPKDAEKLLKIIINRKYNCHIQKTTRGIHFYFKNDDVNRNSLKSITAVGIKVELKVNENTLIPVVIDSHFREWIQIFENIEKIPIWLKNVHNADQYDFLNLIEGSRNDTLFRYQGHLLRIGFSASDVIETINIINEFILENPLEQKEIDTILRDVDKQQERTFFNKNAFLHNKFGDFLFNNETIAKINNKLHIQLPNYLYSSKEKDFEKIMIKRLKIIKSNQRNETFKYLNLLCEKEVELSNECYIPLESKIYDLETKSFLNYNKNFVFKNKINYDPGKTNELVDKTLDKVSCNDKELRALIEEMIGYMFFRRNELRKSFMLIGDKQSGKSTILKMIIKLLGKDNLSFLSLKDLQHTFRPAELDGKIANIGDDIDDGFIEDDSLFKKLVSGENVMLEKKGKDPFEYKSTVKFIYSANKLPKINDKGEGFMSRIIVIPFNAKFDINEPDFDPFINDKLQTDEAMRYLLSLALEGLVRVISRNSFTKVLSVEKELENYKTINNPILLFIDEEPKIENEITTEIYKKYTIWCVENGYKPFSNIHFSREICRILNFTTEKVVKINGKRKRMFTYK